MSICRAHYLKTLGSEFQTVGPVTENARVTKVLPQLAELTVDDIWQVDISLVVGADVGL